VLVSTARLSGWKRVDRLLEAFESVSDARHDLWLALAGDGPFRAEVETFINGSRAKQRIKLLGYVEDVSAVLQASDIFVLPSDNEGFGIALTEAMATKLVCIATRTAGPDDIIEDGKNGLLVDVRCDGVLTGL